MSETLTPKLTIVCEVPVRISDMIVLTPKSDNALTTLKIRSATMVSIIGTPERSMIKCSNDNSLLTYQLNRMNNWFFEPITFVFRERIKVFC
jgi:hypothetical protein